jgi:pimeloyl-ACP methyl ester carboxylesterase
MGHSLGGLVVARLAELGSGRYAGVLPLCGPVGGGPQQVAYLGDVRVLFDFYFPGRIPSMNAAQPATSLPEPPPAWGTTAPYTGLVENIAALVRENRAQAEEMARINQVKLPYSNLDELVHSFIEPLYFNVRGTNNLLYLAGGNPFDNSRTSYSGISRTRDRQINSGVIRYAASSTATTYLKDHADTSGRLNTLVLTLHTNQDAAVPYLHQSTYANKVSAARRSSRLVQQYVNRYGHCNFKDTEILSAFEGLVRWAESPLNLLKPRSGDVTQN